MRQLFERRIYNIRVVNIVAAGVLAVLALGLYMAKMQAAEDRDEIAGLRAQLLEHRRAITVLKAEIAHLEEPDRLKYLAQTYLGLSPREARQEPGQTGLVASIEAAEAKGVHAPAPVQAAAKPASAPAPTQPVEVAH